MTATPETQVRAARTEGGRRERAPDAGDRRDAWAAEARDGALRTSAESDVRSRYAELQASGLACDRW